MKEALEASGAQIVTVALRRADLTGSHDPAANILDFIDPEKYLLLPNTSGATTAERSRTPGAPGGSSRAAQLDQAGDSPGRPVPDAGPH